jgi:hypothetical protein
VRETKVLDVRTTGLYFVATLRYFMPVGVKFCSYLFLLLSSRDISVINIFHIALLRLCLASCELFY